MLALARLIRFPVKSFILKTLYGVVLLSFSVLFYVVYFAVFRDLPDIGAQILGGLAFMPIELLLLTLVLDGITQWRASMELKRKMSTTVGLFFHEVGNELINDLTKMLQSRDCVAFGGKLRYWKSEQFRDSGKLFRRKSPVFKLEGFDLRELRDKLRAKRGMLLMLLSNPNVVDHEALGSMLWGLTHIVDELETRKDMDCCPAFDAVHLEDDFRRIYTLLVTEYLHYLLHLKKNFPMLFVVAAESVNFLCGDEVGVEGTSDGDHANSDLHTEEVNHEDKPEELVMENSAFQQHFPDEEVSAERPAEPPLLSSSSSSRSSSSSAIENEQADV